MRALLPALGPLALAGFLPPLNAALAEFNLATPSLQAAFLAQLGHESSGLKRWSEDLHYTPERLRAVFPRRFETLQKAADVVAGGPEVIAETLYGMRLDLGNVEPGDGFRYRGRGPHQLTGRANYTRHGEKLEGPLAEDPDLVATPSWGFRSAALFATEIGLGGDLAAIETLDAFRALTARWNGGLNGLDDRLRRWREARAVFGLAPVTA